MAKKYIIEVTLHEMNWDIRNLVTGPISIYDNIWLIISNQMNRL